MTTYDSSDGHFFSFLQVPFVHWLTGRAYGPYRYLDSFSFRTTGGRQLRRQLTNSVSLDSSH